MEQLAWANLQNHYEKELKSVHLKDLLKDDARNQSLQFEHNNITLDLTHEKINQNTLLLFEELTQKAQLREKINAMFSGQKINKTEDRAVLHVALRANKDQQIIVDGKNVVPDVHEILGRIEQFSSKVRSGEIRGYTGKALTNLIVIGIGGSYLSIEFVYEALRSQQYANQAAQGRKIKFLANVDPIDFNRAVENISAENTLLVINSKTFTTAETILNAKTVKNWLISEHRKLGIQLDSEEQINKLCNAHISAVSTNIPDTSKFGIQQDRVFGFWDWVGGRFSVWSAIGILPLSIHFGFNIMQEFLRGGNDIDQHLINTKEIKNNIALLLGLVGFYNTTILKNNSRAILPYCQALCKFVPHIQQLDMESNGKRVSVDGRVLTYDCTVVNFGEPGTNGQHSFYQLLHQGRVIPCEFIGFIKSQCSTVIDGEAVTNHEELMSNFFSQPDALACGKTEEELKKEKCPEHLQPHKVFLGDRPSLSILVGELNAFSCGQLLALYEHRTSIEGFIWNVNSYDQWGVELGKVLAKNVRNFFKEHQGINQANFQNFSFNTATQSLLQKFTQNK